MFSGESLYNFICHWHLGWGVDLDPTYTIHDQTNARLFQASCRVRHHSVDAGIEECSGLETFACRRFPKTTPSQQITCTFTEKNTTFSDNYTQLSRNDQQNHGPYKVLNRFCQPFSEGATTLYFSLGGRPAKTQ